MSSSGGGGVSPAKKLGYGDQVEVVRPKELRQIVVERLRKAARQYRAAAKPAGGRAGVK